MFCMILNTEVQYSYLYDCLLFIFCGKLAFVHYVIVCCEINNITPLTFSDSTTGWSRCRDGVGLGRWDGGVGREKWTIFSCYHQNLWHCWWPDQSEDVPCCSARESQEVHPLSYDQVWWLWKVMYSLLQWSWFTILETCMFWLSFFCAIGH